MRKLYFLTATVKRKAQEADVKPAVADTSENRNEENNEEKDKGKNGISAVADQNL